MGKVILTQVQASKNLYLYPNSDICTGDWNYDATLYSKIDDPYNAPDDDETYTSVDTEEPGNFMCGLTDHTSETGRINYVQVVARARLFEGGQAPTSEFKIVISPTSSCTDYYESNNFNLVTVYNNFNYVWTVNPSTSTEWTWDDIDNLSVGLYIYNPNMNITRQETLRPAGAGIWNEHEHKNGNPGDENNYTEVNEINRDDFGTYIYSGNPGYNPDDTYRMSEPTTSTGEITSVTVFNWIYCPTLWGSYEIDLVTGGNTYRSGWRGVTMGTWTLVSNTWNENPNTLTDWTWDDIDTIEGGIHTRDGRKVYITQTYMVLNITELVIIPELRATQLYTIVNYSTTVTCGLNKPTSISKSHSRNTKMLNFWNGQREVYDLNRSGHSMILKGVEYTGDKQFDNTPCDRIQCIREIGKEGSTIVLSGLTPRIFNGDYKIRSFSWEEISNKPQTIIWMLELEKNDL